MFWIAVVHRNLLIGFDVSEREEHHPLARNFAHKCVRLARVVDEGCGIAANRSVNGNPIVAKADDLHLTCCRLRTTPRGNQSSSPDEFTGVGRDLLTFPKWNKGKASVSPNPAWSDFEC